MSWAELSGALGVSKQAAHKRFNELGQTRERVRSTLLEGLERIIRERARR